MGGARPPLPRPRARDTARLWPLGASAAGNHAARVPRQFWGGGLRAFPAALPPLSHYVGAALVTWAIGRLARCPLRRSFADGTEGHDGRGGKLNEFGWAFRDTLSADENYLDLASALARNSVCTCGHMGCVIVKDGKVIAKSVNTPLFSPTKSDVHAEVNAISQCAAAGVSTRGATAYITMPPCKHCYMVLQAAKITRIVSRTQCLTEVVVENAGKQGIEIVTIKDSDTSLQRRKDMVEGAGVDRERIEELRRERKRAKQEKKAKYTAGGGGGEGRE